ncbi:MAG: hypothetical protein ACRDBL_00590 [Rhabdaerophilum sp.]
MGRVAVFSISGVAGFFVAVFAVISTPLPALAASNCDAIQNPFQYNECLAKQAPGQAARGGRRAGGTGGADPEASVPARRRNQIAPQVQDNSGVNIRRSTGRRVSATIDPWAGSRRAAPAKKRRR